MSPPAGTSLLEEPIDQDFDEQIDQSTLSPDSHRGALEGLFALACPLLLILAVALNPLDQSDSTPAGSAGAGLTMEVALKLLLSGAVGSVALLGWILCPAVRQRLMKFPGWILVALGGVFVVTSTVAFGPAATVSRAAAMISCVYIVFIAVTLQFLTLRQTLQCVLVGLVLHLMAAWCLYLGGGETAVYQEELGQSLIIERMGSTAHPNSLGRIGALAILVCLGLWRTRNRPLTPILIATMGFVFVISTATMFESMSRTAVVSCAASVLAVMIDRLANRRGLAMGLCVVMGICLLMLAVGLLSEGSDVGSRVVAVGTKTGDVNELTSATGRTEIWAEAIRFIAQRPLTGWGLNSAPLLLEDFSHHTHNLLLHALFSAGIFAGICVSVLVAWTVYHAFTVVDPMLRGIAAYICVSGLFEDTAFETFPFASTLLWLLVLLAASVEVPRSDESNNVLSDQLASDLTR